MKLKVQEVVFIIRQKYGRGVSTDIYYYDAVIVVIVDLLLYQVMTTTLTLFSY
jgi:hypothetical protein